MFPGSTLARLKLALAAAKRGNSEGAQRLLASGTEGEGGRGLEHEMAAMMMMDGGYVTQAAVRVDALLWRCCPFEPSTLNPKP
jgi:hypothetical protein